MIFLGIDTAHPHDQMVALIRDGTTIGKKAWQGKWNESETVLPHIVTLLKKKRLAFRDLSGIVVHQGPGSFSSVRIGVTIANSLAYALNIPIYGISTSLIDFCREFPKSMKDKQVVVPLYTHAAHISKSTGLWHKISSKH